MIYLYFVLMKNGFGNKKKSYDLIKHGKVTVNNSLIYDPKYNIQSSDIIQCNGLVLDPQPLVYYMFNKPQGYVSANYDRQYPCVLDFFTRKDLSIVGRLDRDTTGLMILTNDKSIIKRVTLPQNHFAKKYYVEVKNKLTNNDIQKCSQGVIIDQNVLCRSSILEIIDDHRCYLTIFEGKYHQVKKMFLSLNNQVINLKRVKIGKIELDNDLKEGEYRLLTSDEISFLKGMSNV